MKLLYCEKCGDVFKLDLKNMRWCKCGRVFGRYIDNITAEVSPSAVSLAIGNGSLDNAIVDMQRLVVQSDGAAPREAYYKDGMGRISHAWVRPNEGAGNPHCRIIQPRVVKLKWVPIDQVQLTNTKVDEHKVEAMMSEGLRLDQMALPAWFDGKKWILTDGNHRLTALRIEKHTEAPIAELTKEEFDWVKFSNRQINLLIEI